MPLPSTVDVLIIGSGFGGSAAALRLVEKGYSVLVVEAGARFADEDFPATTMDVRRYLFKPELGCYGIQRIDLLNNVMILSGAGVGGGSLVYANTLYEPGEAFYRDRQWSHITDWRAELAPYYDQARRMLGVQTNPTHTPADEVMRQIAEKMGVGNSFRPAPVGVFFGPRPPGSQAPADPASQPDPYFGGVGPRRTPCRECGACMTGCRYNSKNTLPKNYLYLAEKNGAQVLPLTIATRIVPRSETQPGNDHPGYDVYLRPTKARLAGRRKLVRDTQVVHARQVIVAAGALGTQRLLHAMRDSGDLPHLSSRLGQLTRTNSESILGAIGPPDSPDYTQGVAITSSFHPDEHTHIEPVRYGQGRNVMALLQSVLTTGQGPQARWKTWLSHTWKQRREVWRTYDLKRWSQRTVIALVMQSHDNSLTTYTRTSRLSGRRVLSSGQGLGAPNPTWIPAGNQAVRLMAQVMKGSAHGSIPEQFNRPVTAHFLGGCPIGLTAQDGVIDPWQRVFGHPGLHVLDGAAVCANLGVNPSLTITAQAERALAAWPNRGEPDQRPPLGEGAYHQVMAQAPHHPAVPAHAPAALHLPGVGVSSSE